MDIHAGSPDFAGQNPQTPREGGRVGRLQTKNSRYKPKFHRNHNPGFPKCPNRFQKENFSPILENCWQQQGLNGRI
ncbi:MAG: hypothetical protein ACI4LQ_03880 [Anaerovoracaceae bacterium]